ncbi:MAG: hypothetical protein Q4D58_00270 [Synergistaceae bacterium]|nr:hypothetical protein [Synergistaceae bacterium]
MKSINIIFSEYGASDGAARCEEAPMSVDLSALSGHYESLGARHRENFEIFMKYWQSEGYEKLLSPTARVMTMPFSVAAENFGAELPRSNKSVETAAMAVWTIGPALEAKCTEMTSSLNDMMTGLLLDVAGSISLYNMHRRMTEWLKSGPARAMGKYINGEFYPGTGSMRQDLIEKVVSLGDTERLIGVRASGSSLLHPRKSQCSLILLGSSEYETEIKMEPCKPCTGRKCLYYQLGGCHIMTPGDAEAVRQRRRG